MCCLQSILLILFSHYTILCGCGVHRVDSVGLNVSARVPVVTFSPPVMESQNRYDHKTAITNINQHIFDDVMTVASAPTAPPAPPGDDHLRRRTDTENMLYGHVIFFSIINVAILAILSIIGLKQITELNPLLMNMAIDEQDKESDP